MKKILFTAALTLLAGAAVADDRIEQQVANDPAYQENIAKAVKILEARGYQVHDVDADDYRGKPALDAEAVKGGKEYDIKLSYPDLKILSEKLDK